MYSCVVCSAEVHDKRVKLGYDTCMLCGDKQAREVVHTVLPLHKSNYCLLYTSPSPRDRTRSRMPSSA